MEEQEDTILIQVYQLLEENKNKALDNYYKSGNKELSEDKYVKQRMDLMLNFPYAECVRRMPKQSEEQMYTLLCLSALRLFPKIMQLLVESGADPKKASAMVRLHFKAPRTPLCLAVQSEMVQPAAVSSFVYLFKQNISNFHGIDNIECYQMLESNDIEIQKYKCVQYLCKHFNTTEYLCKDINFDNLSNNSNNAINTSLIAIGGCETWAKAVRIYGDVGGLTKAVELANQICNKDYVLVYIADKDAIWVQQVGQITNKAYKHNCITFTRSIELKQRYITTNQIVEEEVFYSAYDKAIQEIHDLHTVSLTQDNPDGLLAYMADVMRSAP